MKVVKEPIEFDWYEGNIKKNLQSHNVAEREAEEVFFDENKREYPDPKHSQKEIRKVVAGKTRNGRLLIIVYTLRKNYIRIISARDLNKRREGDLYEKAA